MAGSVQTMGNSSSLADILERILDKGVVIAGDIKISLADVELLAIKIRLVVASIDKAKEMGIDWWERDKDLSSKAYEAEQTRLEEEKQELETRVRKLETMLEQVQSKDTKVTNKVKQEMGVPVRLRRNIPK